MSTDQAHTFPFKGQTLILLPEKALFWVEECMLIIADLHVGKTLHFRNAGIGIPQETEQVNWEKLTYLLLNYPVKTCVFLGDLIHSDYNQECETLFGILDQFTDIHFVLTEGNHDTHSIEYLRDTRIEIVDALDIAPFLLTHIPLEEESTNRYNLSGHVHPAVRLQGKARQYLRLPCFYFGAWQGILPAFGSFTGSKTIKPNKEDSIFVCTNDKVVKVS